MMCQILFSRKNKKKKHFRMSSAERDCAQQKHSIRLGNKKKSQGLRSGE